MENGLETKISRGRRPVWMLHLAALILHSVFFLWGAAVYDTLPSTVATHWGSGGYADAWEEKSFGTVFLPLIVGVAVSLLLGLISAGTPLMMPLDDEGTRWSVYRREGGIRGTVAALGATSILLAVLVGYVSVSGWSTPEHVVLWPAMLLTGLALAAVAGCFSAAGRWARRAAALDGVYPTAEEQAEDAKWVAGILYNDPLDPRVLVAKRQGTGTTVNVGNAQGRAVTVLFLLLFVVLPMGIGIFTAL